MSEVLRQIQVGLWIGCLVLAATVAACCLIPSLRGPAWTGNEWQTGIILALLAVALK